jgi:hypothetical protein
VFADALLQARRTILIPGDYYKGGVSLSPRPVDGEEEEAKKSKVRRWMVTCKVADYDVALLYLKQSDFDLDQAIDAYMDDERWERDHPIRPSRRSNRVARPFVSRNTFGMSWIKFPSN